MKKKNSFNKNSGCTYGILRLALKKINAKTLEQKHRTGYTKKPIVENEFDIWEKEQVWID